MYGQTFCLRQLSEVNTSVSVAQILQNNPNLQHVKGKADIGIKVRIFFAKELHHFLNLCRAGLSEACGQLNIRDFQ